MIAMLDATKFSFKGKPGYRAEIEAAQNEVCKVVRKSRSTYELKVKGATIRVPKSWVIIL